MQIFEGTIGYLRSMISPSQRGVKDVGLSLIPQVVRSGTNFVIAILLARGLGPGGMGLYALVLSVTDTVTGFSDLGVGQTALRYASSAASRNDSVSQLVVLRWTFRIRLALVIVLGIGLFLLAPYLASEVWQVAALKELLRIGLSIPLFTAVAAVPVIYFQSLKRFGTNAIVQVGQSFITLAAVLFLAVLDQWSVSFVILAVSASVAIGAVAFLFIVPRGAIFPIVEPGFARWWKLDSQEEQKYHPFDSTRAESFALYMMLATVIVMVTSRLDIWLIGVYLNEHQIGLYSVASRLTVPLVLVLGALTTALWPRASSLANYQAARDLIRKTLGASLVLTGAGMVYALTVPLLIPTIFGSSYEDSILLAQLLCIGYCVAMLTNPVAVVGYSFGLARIYWVTNLLQFFVATASLLILLPLLGTLGAALTFVVSNGIGGTINGIFVWKKVRDLIVKNPL